MPQFDPRCRAQKQLPQDIHRVASNDAEEPFAVPRPLPSPVGKGSLHSGVAEVYDE